MAQTVIGSNCNLASIIISSASAVILLHRLTPPTIFIITVFALGGLLFFGKDFLPTFIFLSLLVPWLFARLLLWDYKRPGFWIFLLTPLLLFLAGIALLFLLEAPLALWTIALLIPLTLALYAENLFTFYHLPSQYQAYALEHLTITIWIGTAFLATAATYLGPLYLNLPRPIIFLGIALLTYLGTSSVYWASKIGFETGRRYALIGTLLLTQAYIVLGVLPLSYLAQAASWSVLWYGYLTLSRASATETLNSKAKKRVVILTLALLTAILLSSTWF